MVATELPVLTGMVVANDTDAPSLQACGVQCLSNGCASFLFKTDDFVEDSHCYSSSSHLGYTGTANVTLNGNTCQNWADQTPQQHTMTSAIIPETSLADAKNYCRDADGHGIAWCYTTNIKVRYELCDVYPCLTNKCRLFSTRNDLPGNRNINGYRYFINKSYDD
ncbi:hypothetical protein ACF0H5_013279 [Mactra antiquata]